MTKESRTKRRQSVCACSDAQHFKVDVAYLVSHLNAIAFGTKKAHDFAIRVMLHDIRQFCIRSYSDLVLAEDLIDAMDGANVGRTTGHRQELLEMAANFIRDNPEVLDETWLRKAGAVFDLIESMRRDMSLAKQALAKYTSAQE